MRVHRRSGAGSENPVINAGARIFGGDSCGYSGGGSLGALEKFDIENFIRNFADVVDAVSVRRFGEGERGKVSEFGGSFGAFGFVDFLLRDFGAGEIDSCAVVAMSVELSAFAGGDDYVHDDYRIVPEHDFVERLVFDGQGTVYAATSKGLYKRSTAAGSAAWQSVLKPCVGHETAILRVEGQPWRALGQKLDQSLLGQGIDPERDVSTGAVAAVAAAGVQPQLRQHALAQRQPQVEHQALTIGITMRVRSHGANASLPRRSTPRGSRSRQLSFLPALAHSGVHPPRCQA